MQKIVIYTQVFYLDAALEYVKLLSQSREVYFFIEVTPESRKANVFNLDVSLDDYPDVLEFSNVVAEWRLESMINYIDNCKEVNFVVYKHKRSLSLDSIRTALSVARMIKKINPDFIHYDDLSIRMLGLYFYTSRNRNKVILNVHDPKPHTGERNYKKEFVKTIFFRVIKKYVCFSEHSKNELRSWLGSNAKIYVMKLLPYTIYRQLSDNFQSLTPEYITFVGRVSPYKGIELFLEAIREVQAEYPFARFRIAGKFAPGYEPSKNLLKDLRVEILDKHLSNEELSMIIISSKLIVCPYLDATQSGVIMSAHALNRPVLVTPVGGLPEYVVQGKSGLIATSVTAKSVKEAMLVFLSSPFGVGEDLHLSSASKKINMSVALHLYRN